MVGTTKGGDFLPNRYVARHHRVPLERAQHNRIANVKGANEEVPAGGEGNIALNQAENQPINLARDPDPQLNIAHDPALDP